MIFRLSQKLNTKIKVGRLESLPAEENPFADWSAHLFSVDRAQYILLSNTKTLYSVVFPGKGITSDRFFIGEAMSSIREFLQADSLEFVYHQFMVPATASVSFAKALDRSVTGSMIDLIKFATEMIGEGTSPILVGSMLNEIPMSALATSESKHYGKPRKAFQLLANSKQRLDI